VLRLTPRSVSPRKLSPRPEGRKGAVSLEPSDSPRMRTRSQAVTDIRPDGPNSLKKATPPRRFHRHGSRDSLSVLSAAEVLLPSPSASTSLEIPVTRSHCTFHKISLPSNSQPDGYRLLVPRCSMAGMEDEMVDGELVDLGEATAEDLRTAEPFSKYPHLLDEEAHAKLARVVGLELLHECEVFMPKNSAETSDMDSKSDFPREEVHLHSETVLSLSEDEKELKRKRDDEEILDMGITVANPPTESRPTKKRSLLSRFFWGSA